jgi:hypothetical protein
MQIPPAICNGGMAERVSRGARSVGSVANLDSLMEIASNGARYESR